MALAAGCSDEADWSDRPLTAQDGVVEGVKFRWTVPEGMAKRDEGSTIFALRGADTTKPSPRLQVLRERAIPPALSAAVKEAKLGDSVVTRQEEVPDGFIVSGHTEKKDQILVNVWRIHDPGALHCQAAYSYSRGIPNFDKTLAMLEKVCLSMGVPE